MKIVLIANPAAGGAARGRIEEAVDLIRRMTGKAPEKNLTRRRGDAEEMARAARDADLVIAAGGDGTANEVANGLVLGGPPMGFLPLGTTNVLARELGMTGSVKQMLDRIVGNEPLPISLGRVNGRYFLLMASAGFDAEAVFRVSDGLKRIGGRMAYAASALRVFWDGEFPELEIVTEEGERLRGHTAVFSKASCYGGSFRIAPEIGLGDPVLGMTLLRHPSRARLARILLLFTLGRLRDDPGVIFRRVKHARVTSVAPVRLQVDGDGMGMLPAEIEVVPDAIRLAGFVRP